MSVRKLSHYEMFETLGSGGFSKVKLGVDDFTKERVALKILKKDKLGSNASIMKQVQRELTAMQKIQHENVLTLREIDWDCVYTRRDGSAQDVILVVLELATGGELFDFLAFTGNFEETIARTYFHQLINGVGYCHSKSICHRDLKPENLLLSEDFTLKLADFGFANSFSENERMMFTECGSLGYMAPEVFQRTGYDGTGADIWSCGVILFIMLAGFPPFQKPAMTDWWFNKLATNRQHLFWEAHCRSAHFSEDVKDFINRVLQPDCNKRMKIHEMIQHPWFQGPTIGSAALTAEMQRRKLTVDENKMREKLERKRGGEGGELSDDGDVAMMRGHGDPEGVNAAGEALPAFPPSMNVITLQQAKGVETQLESLSLSAQPASVAISNSASLPVFPSASPFSFTQFRSFSPVSSIVQGLTNCLQTNKFRYQILPEDSKIKASLLTANGAVEFIIQFYRSRDNSEPGQPEELIVSLRKLSGDSSQFRMIFADLKESVKELVAPQN